MGWYIGVCIVLFLFQQISGFAKKTGRDKTKIYLFLSMLLLLFMAAFRSIYVGADTRNYYGVYIQLKNATFMEALTSNVRAWSGYEISLEVGYRIFMWIVGKIFYFFPDTIFMAATHLIILLFLYFVLKEQSPDAALSLWLYVTLGFYQTSLNMSRNAISIMIVLWAIRYIKSNNPIKWCIACMFASTIHTSALIFIPLYWVCRIQFSRKTLFVSVVAVITAVLMYDRMLPLVAGIIPDRYVAYLYGDEALGVEQYMVLLLHVILILVVFWCGIVYRNGIIMINWKVFSRNIYTPFIVMEILFYACGFNNQGIVRAGTAAAPAIVLMIPVMIQEIDYPKARKAATRLIFVFAFFAYIMRMSINNIGLTQPYQFAF